MGDFTHVLAQRPTALLRAAACAAITAAAALALTSCTLLGATPGTPGPSDTGPVLDPSIPSASPTVSDSAAPTATPSASAVVTVSPAPSPSGTATPADTRTAVTPFLTSATVTHGDLNVSAIVPKIVERGGTCTVTATRAGAVRTAHAGAAAASSYTGCEPLTIRGLAAGTWQVRVRYASSASAGVSASRTVTAG